MNRASMEQQEERKREKNHIHLKLIGNGFSVCFIILSWTWQRDSVCCRKEVLLCCTLEEGKTYWYTRKARCCAHSEEREEKKVEREINKKLRNEELRWRNWISWRSYLASFFPTFFSSPIHLFGLRLVRIRSNRFTRFPLSFHVLCCCVSREWRKKFRKQRRKSIESSPASLSPIQPFAISKFEISKAKEKLKKD